MTKTERKCRIPTCSESDHSACLSLPLDWTGLSLTLPRVTPPHTFHSSAVFHNAFYFTQD